MESQFWQFATFVKALSFEPRRSECSWHSFSMKLQLIQYTYLEESVLRLEYNEDLVKTLCYYQYNLQGCLFKPRRSECSWQSFSRY